MNLEAFKTCPETPSCVYFLVIFLLVLMASEVHVIPRREKADEEGLWAPEEHRKDFSLQSEDPLSTVMGGTSVVTGYQNLGSYMVIQRNVI